MTIDGFLPAAAIIGGIVVASTLIYTIFYAFHVKVIKYGAWWAWPLLTFYAVSGVLSFICAVLAWNGAFDQHEYGFYGDYDNARHGWSFALVGVLSIFLFASARHAISAASTTKAK